MFNPKTEVYDILKSLGCDCSQSGQNIFNKFPAITYRIDNNSVNLDLDNEITHQEILVTVDIWAEQSIQVSEILAQVEAKMRQKFYRLSGSMDVPNPDNSIHHTVCRFQATKPNNH